jgi:hypothetical protein
LGQAFRRAPSHAAQGCAACFAIKLSKIDADGTGFVSI